MKAFFLLLPFCLFLLPGCAARKVTATPHVCRYQETEARIVWVDHHGWMIEHNGTQQEIKIKQPSREFELLMALDSKITALEYTSAVKEKTRIYAVGRLLSCIHPPPQITASQAELASTCLHTGDEHKYRNFILERWYLKKPFYEAYYDEFLDEPAWKIIKRTALQVSDFEHHRLQGKNIVLKAEDWERRVR
jgi:hypothetical protein